MIRRIANSPSPDVIPQALIWRPVEYFSANYEDRRDDFDEYRGVEFQVGNWLRFDLRRYAGHPAGTSTIYFPLEFDDLGDIEYGLGRALDILRPPRFSVAWKRGQDFSYGVVVRPSQDRLKEPEARILSLKAAAHLPGRKASTDVLIDRIGGLFNPSDLDKQQSKTRRKQPQWHQIVRNVISHRTSPVGPFVLGYAVRTTDGLQVTDEGIKFLEDIGYLA